MVRYKYIIIFVLVLALIFILCKRTKIKEMFNSRKYYDELEQSKKPTIPGDISLVLFYKEGCSITREFLYGCCDELEHRSLSDITERTDENTLVADRNQETGYFITPNPSPTYTISENENYVEGTKCPPLNFLVN